jgi:hypothetical protein
MEPATQPSTSPWGRATALRITRIERELACPNDVSIDRPLAHVLAIGEQEQTLRRAQLLVSWMLTSQPLVGRVRDGGRS